MVKQPFFYLMIWFIIQLKQGVSGSSQNLSSYIQVTLWSIFAPRSLDGSSGRMGHDRRKIGRRHTRTASPRLQRAKGGYRMATKWSRRFSKDQGLWLKKFPDNFPVIFCHSMAKEAIHRDDLI